MICILYKVDAKSHNARQYLNRKILHGGHFCSLDQTRKYFSRNYVIPSPKLNEDQKKKSLPQFWAIFGRNLKDLFVLAGFFLTNHPARSNLDGGTLNLDFGTLNLDEGTRPPYNLSTDGK